MPKARDVRVVSGAGLEITRRWGKHAVFTGMEACAVGNRLVVFRIPGNQAFDEEVRDAANRWHVVLVLVDTTYSRAALEHAQSVVFARVGDLAAKHADLVGTAIMNDGYLSVAVQNHVSAARKVLADLGDLIEVGRFGADVDERAEPLTA